MPQPLCNYPSGSKFGQSVSSLIQNGSDPVAAAVARKFLRPGFSAFVSDGSSTFSVGLEFLASHNGPLVLRTNNLALAHEFSLWRMTESLAARLRDVTVEIPAGIVDCDLLMVHGCRAERHAAKAAAELDYCILSVKGMFPGEGPTGWEHNSLRVKRAVVEKARRIVWVSHWKKLSQYYKHEEMPPVYLEHEWEAACKKKNMWLVTSRPPRSASETEKGTYVLNVSKIKEKFTEQRVIEVSID